MKVPEMPEADPDRNWANMFQTLRSVRIKKLEIWAKTLRSSDRIETWPGAGDLTWLRVELPSPHACVDLKAYTGKGRNM